jgi:hypothetical protein
MIFSLQGKSPITYLLQKLTVDSEAKHYHRLKSAVWLYLFILSSVHPKSGKLVLTLSDIATQAGIKEETVSSWLGHLRKWNYVSVIRQDKSLLLSVTGWKTETETLEESTLPSKNITNKGRKKPSKKAAIEKDFPSEPDKLAKKISEELRSPQGLIYFERLCKIYPRSIILKAFEKAMSIPENKIRKSRAALFAYLVKKYVQEK